MLKLDYEYSKRAEELLAIIGEAYIGMQSSEGSDRIYYKNKLEKAIATFDELEEDEEDD